MLKTTTILLFLIIAIIGGCKKYPEDPATIHLRTAKQKLSHRIWYTDRAKSTVTGIDYSGSQGSDRIHFYKSGTFEGENALLFKFNGKWEFKDRKNKLRIFNDTKSFSFHIIRLDAHNLSIKNDSIRCDYH